MSDETEALRMENSLLQRRISTQRRELSRLSNEVRALSKLTSQYAGLYYDLRKRVDADSVTVVVPEAQKTL